MFGQVDQKSSTRRLLSNQVAKSKLEWRRFDLKGLHQSAKRYSQLYLVTDKDPRGQNSHSNLLLATWLLNNVPVQLNGVAWASTTSFPLIVLWLATGSTSIIVVVISCRGNYSKQILNYGTTGSTDVPLACIGILEATPWQSTIPRGDKDGWW